MTEPAREERATVGSARRGRPFTFADLIGIGRLGEATTAPGTDRIVFEVASPSMAANKLTKELWTVPASGAGVARPLARGPHSNGSPRLSPDGQTLAFISDRGGSKQVWLLPMAGGEAVRLTDLPFDVSGPRFAPDGRTLLVTGKVDPAAPFAPPPSGDASAGPRHERELLFRHWDAWRDGKKNHLFAVDLASGQVRDLSPGDRDVPPIALGGSCDYDVAPSGGEIAFARNDDPMVALSTSNGILTAAVAGGELIHERRVTRNRGCEANPRYSPDGRWLALLAMARAGYESDRRELVLVDRSGGGARSLTAELDLSAGDFAWAPDSRQLYFHAEERGRKTIWRVAVTGGAPVRITEGSYDELKAMGHDGTYLVIARQNAVSPAELHRLDLATGAVHPLTQLNAARLAGIDLAPLRDFTFPAADGVLVHGFLVLPPNFTPGRRYPLVYLVHGGPHAAFADQFGYRWNAHLFAAPGYVVAMVNPRGSSGYGQLFSDQIRNDWGGRVFDDLMRGVDHLLATCDFIDGERMAAAGASFGGYMMNWFAGHTDRFRTLVNHAGIWNLETMYYGTEELWFPHWELEGSPAENPAAYARWSPDRALAAFKTPMLVIHGEQDFRCPVLGGINVFTALRARGVPAELLYFPDEGHWIEKPRNAATWYATIHAWLGRWLG
jgi:dipeptidyl aminopeptidase/acylaminoacyl peptidase